MVRILARYKKYLWQILAQRISYDMKTPYAGAEGMKGKLTIQIKKME